MAIIAVGTGGFSCMQAAAIWSTEEAAGVSLYAYILFLAINISWMIHGNLLKDWPIRVSSALGFLGSWMTIIGILRYGA